MNKIEISSEIEVTLKMIGGKCKPFILYILITRGSRRFKELLKEINQIPEKTLSVQLKELAADGLITRKSYDEMPPRVEYTITDKGKTLLPILDLMCEWGESNLDENFVLLNAPCSEKKRMK